MLWHLSAGWGGFLWEVIGGKIRFNVYVGDEPWLLCKAWYGFNVYEWLDEFEKGAFSRVLWSLFNMLCYIWYEFEEYEWAEGVGKGRSGKVGMRSANKMWMQICFFLHSLFLGRFTTCLAYTVLYR